MYCLPSPVPEIVRIRARPLTAVARSSKRVSGIHLQELRAATPATAAGGLASQAAIVARLASLVAAVAQATVSAVSVVLGVDRRPRPGGPSWCRRAIDAATTTTTAAVGAVSTIRAARVGAMLANPCARGERLRTRESVRLSRKDGG